MSQTKQMFSKISLLILVLSLSVCHGLPNNNQAIFDQQLYTNDSAPGLVDVPIEIVTNSSDKIIIDDSRAPDVKQLGIEFEVVTNKTSDSLRPTLSNNTKVILVQPPLQQNRQQQASVTPVVVKTVSDASTNVKVKDVIIGKDGSTTHATLVTSSSSVRVSTSSWSWWCAMIACTVMLCTSSLV